MIIDLHVHTTYGSECSCLDPKNIIKSCKNKGIEGCCITEHDTVWDKEKLELLTYEDDFLIIRGMEVSTDYGHILVFGLNHYISGIHRVDKLKKVVEESGGVMILAHPFRMHVSSYLSGYTKTKVSTVEEISKHPIYKLVDGLELYNSSSTQEEISLTKEIANIFNLRLTGGSDAHSIESIGNCVSVFEKMIKNEEEFITELKAGRFVAKDLRRNFEGV